MNSCKCLFEATGRLAEFVSPDMVRALFRRLPICVQEKFAQLSFDKKMIGMSATFSNLTKLVSNSAKFAKTEWAQQLFRAQKVDSMERNTKFKKFLNNRLPSKTFALFRRPVLKDETLHFKLCFFCETNHHIWRCLDFADQPVLAQKSFVLEKFLCVNYL